jgi:hypothetical protein
MYVLVTKHTDSSSYPSKENYLVGGREPKQAHNCHRFLGTFWTQKFLNCLLIFGRGGGSDLEGRGLNGGLIR